ncbi:MAG: hypothetical protein K2G11_08970, partial [Muribaculaceae bacterium]|nr:hypothetical protein [Muribaculaceae bacterium]
MNLLFKICRMKRISIAGPTESGGKHQPIPTDFNSSKWSSKSFFVYDMKKTGREFLLVRFWIGGGYLLSHFRST